ncbi:alpha/beta fold hydrolase [Hydrogenivirga sp.]
MTLVNPVFIHGWAFSSKVFSTLRGVKPDLPAHGANRESYRGLERVVEDIAFSLHGRHDVVGWSLGGSIALMLALRFPGRVNRLFLIGTSPFFGGAWSERNIRAFKMRIKREGIRYFREIAYPGRFEDGLEEKDAMDMLEDYINLDLRRFVPLVKKETFIIQGEKDVVVPVKEALKLHNLIRGSKLIILPGGHFPAEDETGLLSTLLKVG